MNHKEILETYVDEILYDTQSGNILHDVYDFYEIIGMVRLAYVYDIITFEDRDMYLNALHTACSYAEKFLKK